MTVDPVLLILVYFAAGAACWCFILHPPKADLLEALFANSPLIACLDVADAIVFWPARLPFIRSFIEGLGEP